MLYLLNFIKTFYLFVLQATEALFVFGFGGYFVWCAGGFALAYIIWGMASIVVGFLIWNKPPAKIFMGDTGSTLLGFLVVLFPDFEHKVS